MKTIGYKDRNGKTIHLYFNANKRQSRWERFFEGLKELKHTGNINIYNVKGNKATLIKIKGY